ncbi:uncharacterized protein [Elaeis guineensis]|uniref:uncharacterized protein isoform X1 n=1 Tax=Elaeis guineensis var. tenera TaxID=51953 RepID=UPI003C6DA235
MLANRPSQLWELNHAVPRLTRAQPITCLPDQRRARCSQLERARDKEIETVLLPSAVGQWPPQASRPQAWSPAVQAQKQSRRDSRAEKFHASDEIPKGCSSGLRGATSCGWSSSGASRRTPTPEGCRVPPARPVPETNGGLEYFLDIEARKLEFKNPDREVGLGDGG